MYVVEQTGNGFNVVDRADVPALKIPDRVVVTIIVNPHQDEGDAFFTANTICDVLNDEVPRVVGAVNEYRGRGPKRKLDEG